MLLCHSSCICATWRNKETTGLKPSYGGKEKSHKEEEFLWGAINKYPVGLPSTRLSELPTILGSFGVKRYMHYITFLLIETS